MCLCDGIKYVLVHVDEVVIFRVFLDLYIFKGIKDVVKVAVDILTLSYTCAVSTLSNLRTSKTLVNELILNSR